MHFFEMGNRFTVNYGDIGEQFYNSLESMFENILIELNSRPIDEREKYFPRLQNEVESAKNIGWGYHDELKLLPGNYMAELYEDEFDEEIF